MAITPRKISTATLTNAVATYYTAGAGVKARLEAFSVVNYSGSPATFSVYLVPSGGVADNSNILAKDVSLLAGAKGRLLEALGQWIEAGGTLQMVASANSAITVNISGTEQTSI